MNRARKIRVLRSEFKKVFATVECRGNCLFTNPYWVTNYDNIDDILLELETADAYIVDCGDGGMVDEIKENYMDGTKGYWILEDIKEYMKRDTACLQEVEDIYYFRREHGI